MLIQNHFPATLPIRRMAIAPHRYRAVSGFSAPLPKSGHGLDVGKFINKVPGVPRIDLSFLQTFLREARTPLDIQNILK